jgi:NitT/TauT family transport system permease protein
VYNSVEADKEPAPGALAGSPALRAPAGFARYESAARWERRLRACRQWLGRLCRGLLRYYPLLVVMAAWEATARRLIHNVNILPSLTDVAKEMLRLMENTDLFYHSYFTLVRAAEGFGAAVVAGVLLGFAMGRFKVFAFLFEPMFSLSYPIPKISIYPILIFVFGLGNLSKVALVFLECFYPIVVATYYGTKSVDRLYIWAARNMGASQAAIFRKVVVPAAAPYIFSGLRVALPISLVLVIITEMIGSNDGLGFLIVYASASFENTTAFAGIVTIALLGFLLDRPLVYIRNKVVFWERDISRVG